MNESRRVFLKNASVAGIAVTSAAVIPQSLVGCHSAKPVVQNPALRMGFEQSPLPYAYSALEPVIDARTMEIHYSRHAAGYAKNLQDALGEENIDRSKSLEEILANLSGKATKLRNNAGGHYNHELFWKTMHAPGAGTGPSGALKTALESSFNSVESFKTQFGDAAKGRFGSGWAWLVVDRDKRLRIGSTPNQDNPLMDVADMKGFPLLGLDVWEHAYYLKYQNRRAEYVDNWWQVVNWEFVEKRYSDFA